MIKVTLVNKRYQIIEWNIVAIAATKVENNIVILSNDILNPKFKIGLFFEIIKLRSRPWDRDEILFLLMLNNYYYTLDSMTEVNKKGRQKWSFSLIEEIDPYVDELIKSTIENSM